MFNDFAAFSGDDLAEFFAEDFKVWESDTGRLVQVVLE